ncbi:MAG: CHAT domain-containing protein [Saprospiraceae bacterium]|jgi:CHAT domain-containing protein
MKFFLTNYFCIFSLMLLGQGDIEGDTTFANLLFSEVKNGEWTDIQAKAFLSETVFLFEKHRITNKVEEIKDYAATLSLSVDKARNEKLLSDGYLQIMINGAGVDYKKSTLFGEEALKITEIASSLYFDIIIYLSGSYAYLGAADKLEELIKSVESLFENNNYSISDKYKVAPLLANLHFNYHIRNYDKAVLYGEEMVRENKKYQLLDTVSLIAGYNDIALAYGNLSGTEKAISYFDKILDLIDEDKLIYRASIFGSMAQIYNHIDLKKSKEYTDKAITGLSDMEEKFGRNIGFICLNQGIYCERGGEVENAEMYYKKSLNYIDNSFANTAYARLVFRQKRYQEALDNVQKGIIAYSSEFDSIDPNDNPSRYETYNNYFYVGLALRLKMIILSEMGEKENSEEILRLARTTGELANFINYQFLQESIGYDNKRMQYNRDVYNTYSRLIQIDYALYQLKNEEEDANHYFQVAESKKIMALLDVFKPNSLPDTILRKGKSLVDSIAYYEQKIALNGNNQIGLYQKKLFDANRNMEGYLDELEKNYPNYYSEQYKSLEISINDIQQKLDTTTLLIEYSISDTVLFIHAIAYGKHQIIRTELTEEDLAIFGQMRKLLQNPLLQQRVNRNKFIAQSHQLYNLLIAPVADFCKGKKNLMIVPEGELFYVPFEVLLASGEEKSFENLEYLVKKYAINYQYSATAYLRMQQKKEINNNSILAFAPVFDNGTPIIENVRSLDFLADSLYRGIENDKFTPLLSTKSEVQVIVDMLGRENEATVLLEANATKINLNREIERQPYRFIHIATHGLVNYSNPKLSGLACYQNENGVFGSGLYFANEIQMQNIQADLVVLSSCESGIGQLVKGEGLIALNRSFIYAGAKNVLFSLWKVNDTYTKDLMIDFYRNTIQEKTSYTTALRNAKLKMLSNPKTASPRYWAPFILMGE